jgi:hypothetical protein
MTRVKLAAASALALTAVAILLTLLHHPRMVERKNGVLVHSEVVSPVNKGRTTLCQAHEAVPRGTTAIEPGLSANTGPPVQVEVKADGRVLASGRQAAGWNGRVVTIPVTPLAAAVPNATICVSFSVSDETIGVHGFETARAQGVLKGGQPLPERMWINYLGPAKQPWMSELHSVARRMELGRSSTGIWVVLLVLALPIAAIAIASRLAFRELS